MLREGNEAAGTETLAFIRLIPGSAGVPPSLPRGYRETERRLRSVGNQVSYPSGRDAMDSRR